MDKHIISINEALCVGCKACIKDCVAHNLVFEKNTPVPLGNNCVLCGHCVAICPKAAISISGFEDKPRPIERIQLNPDEVFHMIEKRRSIRQFKDIAVPQEIIAQILEAGRLTHTASNKQDISFIVLRDKKEDAEKLAVNLFRKIKRFGDPFSAMWRQNKITDHFFFFQAPLVIAIASKSKIDGALAAANMEFVAEANGLGLLYSGFFSIAANLSFKLKHLLQVPKGKKVVTTLVIGYPKVEYHRTAPRENGDIVYL